MPRKKTADPARIKLLDGIAAAEGACAKCYRRARRWFNALDKARRQLSRLHKRLFALDSAPKTATEPRPCNP